VPNCRSRSIRQTRGGGGAGAAGEPVHRHHDGIVIVGCLQGSALPGGDLVGGGRGAQALDRLVQLALRQRIGHEIIGTEAQKLMQRDRAHLLGDEDDLDALFLGGSNDLPDSRQFRLILIVHRDGNELQVFRLRLMQKQLCILE